MQPIISRRAIYLLVLVLLALAAAARAEYRETSVAGGGSVAGRVYFASDYPPAETIRPDRDADTCGIRIPNEQFVVDENSRGLANVVVRIEGITSGKPFETAKAQIEQVECRYVPRVTVVRPGREFDIVNQDPVLHNVHAYREDDTLFNLAQPFQGQASPQTVNEAGIVRVACDVHSWMQAWVVVLDNPYFEVTDPSGSFSITDVPPGSYTVTMWHEALGSASKTVVVEAGGSSEVSFEIGG